MHVKIKIPQLLLFTLSLSLCQTLALAQKREISYTKYVNPFIGTGGHGHTYPGATMPFGMVQLSPDTGNEGWDWCSGYHYSDTSICGFSHTHLSGTGVGDLGDILVMPGTGPLRVQKGDQKKPGIGYRSSFSHQEEIASPGYYSVFLKDYHIKAELTATEHAGFHRYTFPKTDHPHILVNLDHGLGGDKTLNSEITVVNDHTIKGYRQSTGWAKNQYVYFTMVFSQPIKTHYLYANDQAQSDKRSLRGKAVKAELLFPEFKKKGQILVKVGISAVDIKGADKNLSAEIKNWNFDKIVKNAGDAWQHELSKIHVEGKADSLKTIFYTSLYHAMLAPTLYSDIDGRYRGGDQKVHKGNFKNYTTFSIWDTFRAESPLLDLIEPERVGDIMRSFLAFEQESGYLPVWPLMGNETYCMTGFHAIPIIADAYLKGLIPADIVESLYQAMIKSANQDRNGIKLFNELGYVPYDKEDESVSKTLDYALDDWCIAKVAEVLKKPVDQKLYAKRALGYQHVFYGDKGFVWGKDSQGKWKADFDPFYADGAPDGLFTEGNSWQYTFLVPQDVNGLVKLLGGKQKLEQKLDQLFSAPSKLTGKHVPPDIDGLIGQYAHGNEPGHHIPYLYNFTDHPSKTQERVRMILNTRYRNKPNGLAGNEDCGQMSAWYVMSTIGIYQVNPADGNFYFGSPLFDKVEVYKAGGLLFRIKAVNNSSNTPYIESASIKGVNLKEQFVHESKLRNGAELNFQMTDKPRK